MIAVLALLLQQGPDEHYAGGASSKTAGTTALAGHFFRFLFSTVPQWVQIAGIAIGVPLAAIVAWQAWKHRRQLRAWWVARSASLKVAMVGAAGVAAITAAGTGLYGYNYVMHENDFCQSCHIMDTAWNRFQVSAHKDLQCHGCHRQPLYASTVELYYWVTERRMVVPVHDKVPTAVCNECHMRAGTDSARTLVTLTAGHVGHLKSDSAVLKDVQCTTCHGRDFHMFIPNHSSCATSGCHMQARVQLGAMSRQGFLHCTLCHNFRKPVAAGATVAQAKAQLIPQAVECTACHAMSDRLRKVNLASDPHEGSCGSCHDVHKQLQPADAFKSCATAQCHASADTLTAFHRGLGAHALDQCGTCHRAHTWKVKGTDCLACHKTIFEDRPALRRMSTPMKPAAFRGSVRPRAQAPAVLRFVSFVRAARRVPRRNLRRLAEVAVPAPPAPTPARDSTFPHSRHKSVACTECHATNATHSAVKFAAPAGCLACHHGARQAAACTACHPVARLGQRTLPVAFTITPRRDPVTRPLAFVHSQHGALACARCHAADARRSVATTCATCHADHHTARADCASCHPTARAGHDRTAHDGCAGCHDDARVAALSVTRPVCLACHQEQRTHYPAGNCAACHAIAESGTERAGRAGHGR